MPIGVLSSYTAKIEPQFNKTCLKWGGNCLKKRVTALVQAYFYLKSFAVFNIFVANYQSLRANCYHKIRLYHYATKNNRTQGRAENVAGLL